MTRVNFDTPNDMTTKVQQAAAIQKNVHRKLGERRPEAPKRSLLRKICLKMGGKVADIFTW